jgi:hypothetical protein
MSSPEKAGQEESLIENLSSAIVSVHQRLKKQNR